jgi:hypothetical protein
MQEKLYPEQNLKNPGQTAKIFKKNQPVFSLHSLTT